MLLLVVHGSLLLKYTLLLPFWIAFSLVRFQFVTVLFQNIKSMLAIKIQVYAVYFIQYCSLCKGQVLYQNNNFLTVSIISLLGSVILLWINKHFIPFSSLLPLTPPFEYQRGESHLTTPGVAAVISVFTGWVCKTTGFHFRPVFFLVWLSMITWELSLSCYLTYS